MKNWRLPFNGKTIREWSFSQGLNLVDDREPVVDDTAAYVGPHGSTVTINGLSRNGRYRLWIDFVRFTTGEKRRDSLLKIFVSAPSVESSCISAVRATDIGEAYFYVDIPRTISVRGSVELSFVEYGASSGNWGVWDIIVSTVGELPRRDDIPRDETINLKVDDRIVQ